MIDAPTAATICVGIMSATALAVSTIWKLMPVKHVVSTKPTDGCATSEQLEDIAKEITQQLKDNHKYHSDRFYSLTKSVGNLQTSVGIALSLLRNKQD